MGSRVYIYIYIYILHCGGTTGVCQINDIHCHLYLEDFYLELEQAFFTKRQQNDPGNVNRTLDEVVADVVTTWRSLDHERSCDGHWATGLANLLNGKEDGEITGEALEVWNFNGMRAEREKAFAEVEKMIADGIITSFADVRKVIKHPPTKGEYRAGGEYEGWLLLGEKSWELPADRPGLQRMQRASSKIQQLAIRPWSHRRQAIISSSGRRATAWQRS